MMVTFKVISRFLFSCLFVYSGLTHAQSLEGKELVRSDDAGSLMETGIGMLFGASKMEGDITKVIVTSDTHNELFLKISYEGFEGLWIKGSILNAEKAKINDIISSPVHLEQDASQVELSFKLKDGTQNKAYRSVLLKLLVCKKETDPTGKVYAFNLDKEWKTEGLSEKATSYDFIKEGEVVDITPVAIGSAAKLKDANVHLPLPARTVKIKFNNTLYNSSITRKTMVLKPVTLHQASTSKQLVKVKPGTVKINPGDKQPSATQQKPVYINHSNLTLKPLQLSKEQVEKGAEGPGNTAISLWDEIMSDVDFDLGSNSITNISTDIFPDKNEASGYYYYFPSSYNLKWSKDDSYDLKMLYGSATGGESGQVNMFVELTPGVGTKEKAMVEELVKEYAKANNLHFEKLLPVPLSAPPEVDLSGQLSSLYNIPLEKITTTVTGLFDPVDLSWPMNTKNADDLMIALKEVDLNGELKIHPQGEMPEVNIPVRISLDDEKVLGRIELKNNNWRSGEWKNEMPFPVKLKYIHALILNKDQNGSTVPFIYSWNLGNKEVPVMATAKINTAAIPKLVDTKAQRIWIEYTVPPCTECKDKIINELTGGTTTSREQKIEVVSYVKDRTNALALEVRIRSRFADPKGEKIIELPPLKIAEDGESYFIGPLFVPEGKQPEYEYQIKLVTDEDVFTSKWIYSTETSLYLNKKIITDAFGKFPGE